LAAAVAAAPLGTDAALVTAVVAGVPEAGAWAQVPADSAITITVVHIAVLFILLPFMAFRLCRCYFRL
jgi:hypothetical protein